jgi:hypothetical protein
LSDFRPKRQSWLPPFEHVFFSALLLLGTCCVSGLCAAILGVYLHARGQRWGF